MRRAPVLFAVLAFAAVGLLPAQAAAMRPNASPSAVCEKETKRLNSFKRGMRAAKRRFFRTHRSKRARARFVRRRNAKLAALKRARRRCLANQPPHQTPPRETPPGGDPPGGGPGPPAEPLATSIIQNVVSEDAEFESGEVSVEDEVEYVRTQLELALAPDATAAQLQALLTRLNATIVSSLEGVPVITVRIPDPGSLDALRALVSSMAGTPGLDHADIPTVPVTTELPSIISASDVSSVRPQLAAKAHAAWNARNALGGRTPPDLVVTDFWGDGPPGPEVAVHSTPSDFAAGNPHPHGYTILGLLAGSFDPGAVPNTLADEVTGTWPGGDLELWAVDLRLGIASSTVEDRILQAVQRTPGDVVVSTSLASGCAPTGCTQQAIQSDARDWIMRVRMAGLESRFLHVVAAGNIYPNLPNDTAAVLGSNFVAAAKMPLPFGLANLSNTIVVENTTASDPANGPVQPLCMTADSKEGGDISAVGNDVKSLSAPGQPRDLPAGGTSSATPQVAGAAAMMWALDNGLSPAEVKQLLVDTAQPVGNSGDPRCKSVTPAPGLDEYSAVLATDRAPTQPVRATIMDVTDANGGAPDGTFDESDIDAIGAQLSTGAGAIEYGRYDLNGDARTGAGTARLDLDGVRPVEWEYSDRRDVLGLKVLRDEEEVRDIDMLCHEAAGARYAGDLTARDEFLEQRCLPQVKLQVDPSFPASVQAGAPTQLRVVATNSGIADPAFAQQPGVRLEYSVTGGTVSAPSGVGTTGADGSFSTIAQLAAAANQLQIEVVARAGVGGPELDRVTVTANRASLGNVTVESVRSRARGGAEACAGRDGEGCTIEFDSFTDQLTAFGTFSGSGSASETEDGTPGFYEGNSASANSNASQNSTIQAVAGPAEIVANGAAGGSSTRTFGANPSAHSAYSSQAEVFMRFTVSGGSVPWSAQGNMASSGTETFAATFALYRTSPFQFVQNLRDQSFNVNGTLAPGTYEVAAGASCAADKPASCAASYDLTFDIDP